jgi:LacI family transcriptional regulator, repressor for deo operon, udp, cdd, tsx, nupC, and nupG
MAVAGRPVRRATIRDVAARAGVAASTVSRALSDPERVHPDTRARIVRAAQALDYRPATTRQLDTAGGGAIALLIPDIANPFYAELARGAQLELRAAGRTQILADTEESAAVEERSLARLGGLAEGVVLTATRLSDEQLRAAAQAIPLVLVNHPVAGLPSVCMDTATGFGQAVEHLASLGHRRIAYMSGPGESWSDETRWRAIRAAAARIRLRASRIGPFTPTFAAGAAAADAVLNSGASACLAFNDLLAAGIVRRLQQRGIGVPEQVSVVGCDDIFAAEVCSPQLTTVTGDLQQVGRVAVQSLVALLEGGDDALAVGATTLPTHLTMRRSTGPAPP